MVMGAKQVVVATRVWTDFDEVNRLRLLFCAPLPCSHAKIRVCLDELLGVEADFERIATLDSEVLFRSMAVRSAHDQQPVLPLLVRQGRSLSEKGC